MRRFTAGVILAGLMVVLAAAPSVAQSTAPAPSSSATAPAADTLTIPFPQDDGTLTPYTFELGYRLMTLVYDTLLWRDADGTPQPWLARSVATSADGRTVTVTLRDGAQWQDGQPVTSEDVAFTFAYMRDHPHPRFTSQLEAVDTVETPAPNTAVIRLAHPSPGFRDQPLADVPILPKHLWDGLPAGQIAPDGLPVGSGPYRLTSYDPQDGYVFEADPDYLLGAPTVGTINVTIIRSAADTFEALTSRRVDMLPVSVPTDARNAVDRFGLRVDEGTSYLGLVLAFNVRQPPFDDPAVRRMVGDAIDVTTVARAVGDAVAADHGYLHPGSPWAASQVLHLADPDAARAALAGRDLGPVQVLAADNDPTKLAAAKRVARSLQGVGLDARAVPVRPDQLDVDLRGTGGAAPSFSLAITTSPPLASYDPDFLDAVFGRDGVLNVSGYASDRFATAMERVRTTADPTARRGAVGDTLQLLAEDLPVLPLAFPNGAFTYRPAIYDGWVYVKGAGILDKRSFLPASAANAADAPEPSAGSATAAPALDTASGGIPPLGWVAVGVLGLAAVVGAAGVLRRR